MSFFQYGKTEYWEKRYKDDPEPFEWYHKFVDIEPLITGLLAANKKVLVIGCGNSSMSDDIFVRNIKDVTSIDISHTVIKQMSAKYSHLKYQQMDVQKLEFADGFDIIMDKGLLDVLFCSELCLQVTSNALDSINRCLNKLGHYISISNCPPEHRLKWLQKQGWEVDVKKLEKPEMKGVETVLDQEVPNHYFLYICKKTL